MVTFHSVKHTHNHKYLSIITLTIIIFSTLSIILVGAPEDGSRAFVSSADVNPDFYIYGTASSLEEGYPVPHAPLPPEGERDTVVSAWRHPTWKRVKASSLYAAGADWVWRIEKITSDNVELKWGSILFLCKEIYIPPGSVIVDASLEITVDNAFYLYITNEAEPVWSGEPLMIDGFKGYTRQSFSELSDAERGALWEEDVNGNYVAKPGVIDTDSSVVQSIENESTQSVNIEEYLAPGTNWLSIVAFNAQPEPNSKWNSANKAGILYKLEVTWASASWTTPVVVPDGVMEPLDNAPPFEPDFMANPLTLNPVQAVWDFDFDGDTVLDMIAGKPIAVQVSIAEGSSVTSVTVDVDGPGGLDPITDGSAEGNVFSCYPFILDTPGSYTVSGTYDPGGVAFTDVPIEVIETNDLNIAFSYLYHRKYGDIDEIDFSEMVGTSSSFIKTAYPIENLVLDTDYASAFIQGESPSKRDALRPILDDCIAVANDAKWRLGSSAFGIGIAPDNYPSKTDYFGTHSTPYAAGISWGPSLKGVIALDNFYSASLHEEGHGLGLYVSPSDEQYEIYPTLGFTPSNGVSMEIVDGTVEAYWRSGLCFMGVAPEEDLAKSWVSTESYGMLFEVLKEPLVDPDALYVSGIVWHVDAELPPGQDSRVVLYPWIRQSEEGYIDNLDPDGDLSLQFYDIDDMWLDEVRFAAPYAYYLTPAEGSMLTPPDYGPFENDYTAFGFSTGLPEGTDYIVLYEYSTDTVLAVVDVDDLVYFDTWMTDSKFNEITGITTHFELEDDGTFTLKNSNPGSVMYNALVDYTGEVSLTITLPAAESGTEGADPIDPAFNLVSGDPVKVFKDLERKVKIHDVEIEYPGTTTEKVIKITMTIPSEEFRYIIVHLDYFQDDPGWTFPDDDPANYYQDLPIDATFESLETIGDHDSERPLLSLPLTTDFEARGHS